MIDTIENEYSDYPNEEPKHRKLTIIIVGVIFGLSCALILALLPLYISRRDPERSNQNITDIWSINYLTNYYLRRTRALAAISRTGLATAMSKTIALGNNTLVISEAYFISSRSFRAIQQHRHNRRQQLTDNVGAPSTVSLSMLVQALYPVECQNILSCQKQFRESVLGKIRNLGEYSLEVPLEDGQIVYITVRLFSLIENYDRSVTTTLSTTTTTTNTTQTSTTTSITITANSTVIITTTTITTTTIIPLTTVTTTYPTDITTTTITTITTTTTTSTVVSTTATTTSPTDTTTTTTIATTTTTITTTTTTTIATATTTIITTTTTTIATTTTITTTTTAITTPTSTRTTTITIAITTTTHISSSPSTSTHSTITLSSSTVFTTSTYTISATTSTLSTTHSTSSTSTVIVTTLSSSTTTSVPTTITQVSSISTTISATIETSTYLTETTTTTILSTTTDTTTVRRTISIEIRSTTTSSTTTTTATTLTTTTTTTVTSSTTTTTTVTSSTTTTTIMTSTTTTTITTSTTELTSILTDNSTSMQLMTSDFITTATLSTTTVSTSSITSIESITNLYMTTSSYETNQDTSEASEKTTEEPIEQSTMNYATATEITTEQETMKNTDLTSISFSDSFTSTIIVETSEKQIESTLITTSSQTSGALFSESSEVFLTADIIDITLEATTENSTTFEIQDSTITSNIITDESEQTTSLSSLATSTTPSPVTVLLSIVNPTSSTYPAYTNYSYVWTATGTSATLSFFFRHDPHGWMLDDVTVYHNSTQLIVNGGFETGTLNSWVRTGSCNLLIGSAYWDSSGAKSGSFYYYSPCALYGETISQTFSTVVGDQYVIGFWLTNYGCCTPTEIVNVTITV